MFTYTYAGSREMKMQIEKEDGHMSRVMCIHIWMHINRHYNQDHFARRAITRALYQDTNIWNYLLLIFQVQTLIGFFVGLPIFYIGFVFLSQIRFWVLSQFLTYWGVYPTFRNFCHTGVYGKIGHTGDPRGLSVCTLTFRGFIPR